MIGAARELWPCRRSSCRGWAVRHKEFCERCEVMSDELFYVVRKLPHGLWEQMDMATDYTVARGVMMSMRAELGDAGGAWDVWTPEQWKVMQDQRLTVDRIEAHSETPTNPVNASPEDVNQIAKRLGQFDDSQVLAAIALSVGQLEATAALYGTIRAEVMVDQACAKAVGLIHLLHQFPQEYVQQVMEIAFTRYHETMANQRRRRELAGQ